jgi:hypothetical protein
MCSKCGGSGVLRNTCSCKNRGPQGKTGLTGPAGADGNGIVSITFDSTTDPGGLPGAAGATDTYRIDYTDGSFALYPVYNGADGAQGPQGIQGDAGVGISNIAWASNSGGQPQGTQGTTDTYTITLTDASTYNFLVTNGADGAAGPQGPAGPAGPGTITWQVVPYAPGQFDVNAAVNNGYIIDDTDAVLVRIYLPAVCAVGDIVEYANIPGSLSNNLYVVPDYGANQTIVVGNQETTNLTGYLEYPGVVYSKSAMRLVCVEANTKWALLSATCWEASGPQALLPNVI